MAEEKKIVGFNPSDIKEGAEVDENNPWEDDALGRQEFAKPLTDWVRIAGDAPFGIAVDGKWGSGKTFLLQRWCSEFSKQGKAIYFNAWEDDFHTDPLTAIIGQLWSAIEGDGWEEICNLWKEKCGTIIKKKALNHVGLEEDDLQTASGRAVKEYLDARQNINTLKERLKKLADATKEETGSPLVVVVDDLDRCCPTFAIKLLERVKHVVGVQGIAFVFGVDQKQLEASIQSVYGEIDATDYLRRFFGFGMVLPQVDASKYCAYLIEKHKIAEAIEESPVHKLKYKQEGWESDWRYAVGEMPAMSGYMRLSLRQIEQAVRAWLFVLRSKEVAEKPAMYMFEGSLVIFILLKIKNRDMYKRFFNGDCDSQEVMNYLFGFLPWEEVQGDEHKKRTDCIVCIVLACYFFYERNECLKIVDEFEQANKMEFDEPLPNKYRYVPQKIVEMKNRDTRQNLILRLLSSIKKAKNAKQSQKPPSLQKVAHFLEWGDNWRV